MEPASIFLIVIALTLAATSVVLWLCLLLYRLLDNHLHKRREQVRDWWLSLLLSALEDRQNLASLPRLRGRLETEAVLGLLRDLAERFRGQYRDNLDAVLHHIGAEDYGLWLVNRSSGSSRMRGCALLAWMAPSARVDEKLATLLRDLRTGVRLEAAHALAARRTPAISLETIITSLRSTGALHSGRARDIVRLMAPGRGGALGWLLETAVDPREKALLLDGLAVAGDYAHASQAALFLSDGSSKVRAAAVSTLEELADPTHIEAVAMLARDPDPDVRVCVARYAKTMRGDLNAIAVLETLSMDRNFAVRRVAVHALAAWRGRSWDQLAFLARQDPLLASLMKEAAQNAPLPAAANLIHAP